ncbi:MAG: SCO family protein [Elusimicrobiota bacterium]|nr:MAG: SCO family protein [Elusimicrobiota bacterium]
MRALPEFSLTAVTVDGTSPFDKRALRGRPWIANFVFTRCAGPCPMLTANMASLQKTLPSRVGLLSFTVDPDNDGPEALTQYARKFGADPRRWFFLTGEKSELVRVVRDGFLLPVVEDPTAAVGERFAHSAKFALVDPEGRVRGWWDGDDDKALAALAEAAAGL